MSLIPYNDVRPWARAIKDRTTRRTMPPWFIEKDVGVQEFKDDPSLSATTRSPRLPGGWTTDPLEATRPILRRRGSFQMARSGRSGRLI